MLTKKQRINIYILLSLASDDENDKTLRASRNIVSCNEDSNVYEVIEINPHSGITAIWYRKPTWILLIFAIVFFTILVIRIASVLFIRKHSQGDSYIY